MKIEVIRERPKAPPIEEVVIRLTVQEAQDLRDTLGHAAIGHLYSKELYVQLSDFFPENSRGFV